MNKDNHNPNGDYVENVMTAQWFSGQAVREDGFLLEDLNFVLTGAACAISVGWLAYVAAEYFGCYELVKWPLVIMIVAAILFIVMRDGREGLQKRRTNIQERNTREAREKVSK